MDSSTTSSSQSFLDACLELTERAERADNLALEVDRLRVDNELLRSRIAELKAGSTGEVCLKAGIAFLRSLTNMEVASKRNSESSGAEAETNVRKRQRIEGPVDQSDSHSRTPPRPEADGGGEPEVIYIGDTSEDDDLYSSSPRAATPEETPTMSSKALPGGAASTSKVTLADTGTIRQHDSAPQTSTKTSNRKRYTAYMDHYGQLPRLYSSIISYRVSKPQPSANSNHKFTTFTIPTSQYPSVSAPPHLFNGVSSSAKSELKCLTVNALHQPHAPTKPGEFGVLFTGSECVRKGNGKDGEVLYDLVVREGNNAWRYYGVYKAIRLENLGRSEWFAVDKDVQRSWARYFGTNGTESHLAKRAEGALTLSRDPSEEDMKSLKSRPGFRPANVDDILKAWRLGRALPFVWGLQCVGYNERYHDEVYEAVQRLEK